MNAWESNHKTIYNTAYKSDYGSDHNSAFDSNYGSGHNSVLNTDYQSDYNSAFDTDYESDYDVEQDEWNKAYTLSDDITDRCIKELQQKDNLYLVFYVVLTSFCFLFTINEHDYFYIGLFCTFSALTAVIIVLVLTKIRCDMIHAGEFVWMTDVVVKKTFSPNEFHSSRIHTANDSEAVPAESFILYPKGSTVLLIKLQPIAKHLILLTFFGDIFAFRTHTSNTFPSP